MTILTINKDNYITAFESLADAESHPETEHFSSAEELAELAAKWPASRLVEIWNNLPGVAPVRKFTDRKTAITRIWKAIEELGKPVASSPSAENTEEATDQPEVQDPGASAPEAEPSTPEPAEEATLAQQANDVAPADPGSTEKTTPSKRPRNSAPREGSKTTIILELLKRPGGATLQEIMDATGWQKHSVRGFLAGTVGKKMGLALVSEKGEDGTRRYSIQA